MDLSIVIPTVNSANIIRENVIKIDRFFSHNRAIDKFEIILAAQKSNDNTFDVIKNIKLKSVRALYIKEKGKGLGLTRGMKKAKYEWILMTDDDLPYNLENFFGQSLDCVDEYDIIIGSRFAKKIDHKISLKRRVASFFYRNFVRALFRIPQMDIQAGIKLIRKNIFEIINYPSQKGYVWDTELLHNANKRKLKIIEIPVFLKQTGSRLRFRREIPRIIMDIITLYFDTK